MNLITIDLDEDWRERIARQRAEEDARWAERRKAEHARMKAEWEAEGWDANYGWPEDEV